MQIVRRASSFWVLVVVAVLAGCGGRGRGGGDRQVDGDVCEVLGSCPGDAGPAPGGGDEPVDGEDDWPAEWIAFEDEVLRLVNELRAQGGQCPSGPRAPAPPLVMDRALREAARLHSRDMGENGFFDHFSEDGRDPFARMIEAGYDGSPGGENIAGGAGAPDDAFALWLSSDGHCRNMTSGSFTEVGVGYAFVEGSPFGHYWTQTFGSR